MTATSILVNTVYLEMVMSFMDTTIYPKSIAMSWEYSFRKENCFHYNIEVTKLSVYIIAIKIIFFNVKSCN